MSTRYAIILAAGEGKRMRPFTDTVPKCMSEICGQSILANALTLFADNGVDTAIVVIGHLANLIRDKIGTLFKGMKVEFVENFEYRNTNSMYSLHLGLQALHEATWVLEGDVFFEAAVLAKAHTQKISWFLDASRKDLDGAYLLFDENRRAVSLDIIRDVKLITGNRGKSIGLLHLGASGVGHVKQWLQQGVNSDQKNLYYDLIIGPHFQEVYVEVVDVGGLKWFEIDNITDLECARQLFI